MTTRRIKSMIIVLLGILFHCSLFAEERQDYLVVNLTGGSDAGSYTFTYTSTPPNMENDDCRTTELWLRRVPAGTFMMGTPRTEIGYLSNEQLQEITISKDFYIGIFQITGAQWQSIMGTRPGQFSNPERYPTRPVDCVSYDIIRGDSPEAGAGWPKHGHEVDDSSFLGILRKKTGLLFDLPTEAQWEYACRAGTNTAYNTGKDITSLGFCPNMAEAGRFSSNGGIRESPDGPRTYGGSAKVGSYLPNSRGIYDMHGNVWEWCLDWHVIPKMTSTLDPGGPDTGTHRLLRGGAWSHHAEHCRAGYRTAYRRPEMIEYGSGVGFRVLTIIQDK